MAHECPFCDEVCFCDGDDTWGLPIPDDCPHQCMEFDGDFFNGLEDDEGDYPESEEECSELQMND